MTDTKQPVPVPSPAAPAKPSLGLRFDLADTDKSWWIGGNDPAFTESDDEAVVGDYAGRPFRVQVRAISPRKLDQLRKKHSKTKIKKGAPITDTDNVSLTEDLFCECVLAWEGIGGSGGDGALPCDDATKRRLARKAWGFANAVVGAALKRGDAVSSDEDAEVARFQRSV